MTKTKIAFLILIMTLLANCTAQLPAATDIATSQATNTPMPVIKPSETIIAQLPTTSSSNLTIEKCLGVDAKRPTGAISSGTLILKGAEYKTYKMNMVTGEVSNITTANEIVSDISVSPNGDWLAYSRKSISNDERKELVIDNLLGQEIVLPWERNWSFITSWLNTQELLLHIDFSTTSEASSIMQSSTFLLLNPFTNERRNLNPDFPNIYEYPLLDVWSGSGLGATAYNALLDRVVYLQGNSGIYQYVLWDMNQKRDLVNFEVVIEGNAIPRWSPDGSRFAFAPSFIIEDLHEKWPAYELYSVDRDGNASKLTNLTEYYPWAYIDDYSWSPDGTQIAFWFSWWPAPLSDYALVANRYLAVVDTRNKRLMNYCIVGNLGGNGRVAPPVWSPDGRKMVVETISPDGHNQIVLIDLEYQQAVQIGSDMIPVGWMVTP